MNKIKSSDKFIESINIINIKNVTFGRYDDYYKYEKNSNAYMIIY